MSTAIPNNKAVEYIVLKISLQSFSLPYDLVKNNDKIRVSITTIPEENKQHFEIEARKERRCNHIFEIGITTETKKILFVFRKIGENGKNPIIASTIIHSKHFPKMESSIYQYLTGTKTNEIQQFKIYEPLEKDHQKGTNRNQIGKMRVNLSFVSPFPELLKNNNHNHDKTLETKPIADKSKYEKYTKCDENVPILNSNN